MTTSSNLPSKVNIIEVAPRDGLQNESKVVPLEVKEKFIAMLADSGLSTIEVTSFVRADKIPQMSDANELYPLVKGLVPTMPCLVPNLRGLDDAIAAGVDTVAVFTATSDEFNKNNINATINESLNRIDQVIKKSLSQNIKVRGYLSTVFGCPYQGKTSAEKAIEVTDRLLEMGCYEVSLGDTIGSAGPAQVEKLLSLMSDNIDPNKLALHFHDTRGLAITNILVALQMGITNFDSSAGGLGGCPYAPGASGNVATEDIVNMLNGLEIDCGVDLDKLIEASKYMMSNLGRATTSKVLASYM